MKVLVSAASKHGATAEIAAAIGRELQRLGVDNDVIAPRDAQRVAHYDGFVLGSAVYAGHWLAQAKDLAEEVGRVRQGRPVWLFSSGPLGGEPADLHDAVDVDRLVVATEARGHQLFNGKLDKDVLGFAERAIAAAVHAPAGDFRDWDAITAWAGRIAVELAKASA